MDRKSVHSTGMGSFVEYETDGTTFIVGRRFAPVGAGPTMKEAFEKLFTREADYIITSYYSGMVEAIKLGLLQQIAPAKQTLWKIPMFIGVGKASIYRDKLSKRITKYLTDEKNLKAVEDH